MRSQHLETVDLGQLEVEQDEPGQRLRVAPVVLARAEQVVERLGAVARHHRPVGDVVASQRPQRQLLVVRVVLDQQDARSRLRLSLHRDPRLPVDAPAA